MTVSANVDNASLIIPDFELSLNIPFVLLVV